MFHFSFDLDSIFSDSDFKHNIKFNLSFSNEDQNLRSVEFDFVVSMTVNSKFLVNNPLDHVFTVDCNCPLSSNMEFLFSYLNSEFHLGSVFIDNGDFERSDDGFFIFNSSVRGSCVSINGDLDVNIDFKSQSSDSIVTVVLNSKDSGFILISKSSNF